MPSILESRNLRFAFGATFIFEQHVVTAIRVEGRIEIDQVHTGTGNVFAQDFEVIAVVQRVLSHVADPFVGATIAR